MPMENRKFVHLRTQYLIYLVLMRIRHACTEHSPRNDEVMSAKAHITYKLPVNMYKRIVGYAKTQTG